jgi:cellulose biosynthesis protein BcsQ
MAPQTPRAIVLASSKGGQGKSVLSAALAVRAARDGRVALIDWEPQGSLSIWHRLRGSPDNPALHITKIGDLAKDVAALKATGVATIILDTPPTPMEPIERAIRAADCVVIPTRVGLFDLGGIRPVIAFCQQHQKPYLFVLNGTNPDEPGWPALLKSAVKVLKRHGDVLPKTIRERAAYISALNSGKSGPESGHTRQARAAAVEIDALWAAVKRMKATGSAR